VPEDGAITDDAAGEDVPPGEEDAIAVDVGPGGCGFGTCTPGTACSPDDGCNTCRCGTDGTWRCSTLACYDAGPPPPPPPPPCPSYTPYGYCSSEGQICTYSNGCGGKTVARCSMSNWSVSTDPCVGACPVSQPKAATACTGSSKCAYSNGCGGSNTAWCDGKLWHVEVGPCVTPSCPSYLPKPGEPCVGPNKCAYPSGCPSPHTAICNTSSSTWTVYYADCPPPPPPTCPASTPPYGAPCSGSLNCQWDNGCGNLNYGYCSSGTWAIKSSGCTPGCPSSKPTSGTACKPPSSTSCTYMVPGTSTCTSQCFCADDYRWACLTPPCATPIPK